MKYANPPLSENGQHPEMTLRIWSIIKRLDQILTELDAMNLHLPACHISLGTELLWQVRSSLPKP